KANCDAQVKAWADNQLPTSMYLSRVKIAEIRYGIERLPTADRSRRAIGGVADQRAGPWFCGSAARCGRGCFCRLASLGGERQGRASHLPAARSVHRSARSLARPMRRDP